MSLLTSFTRPSVTNSRGPLRVNGNRVEPVDGRLISGSTTVTADLAYLSWFRVDTAMVFTAMEYLCATAAGNVDLGVFTTTDFTNFTLLGHTGATAAAGASAVQSINLLASVTCVPGKDYYASIVGSNAALAIARITIFNAIAGANKTSYQKAALDPLADFATPANTNLVPWLVMK